MTNESQRDNKHNISVKKGDIIQEKYRVLSHISSGGTSEVYLIEEVSSTDKRWALKVVKQSNPLADSITNEANILSELEHPGLPFIVDYFSNEKYHFLVMEYISGVSLSDYLAIYNQSLPLDLVIRIGKQLCEVFYYLHEEQEHPIIYRDIKPGNILIKADETIKLIDFGTAQKHDSELLAMQAVGTVGFAAPEQFEKKLNDERTDLFSLGALFYYLLSDGKYVNKAERPIKAFAVNPIPESLKLGVLKLIELKPNDRIQTIEDVKVFLTEAEEELFNSTSKN